MAEPPIDFTWHRDVDGYRLVPGSQFLLAAPGSQTDQFLARGERHPTGTRHRRKGGPLKSYRPLNKFRELFNSFVKIQRTSEGVLDFITNFGPLTISGRTGEIWSPPSSPMPTLCGTLDGLSRRLGGRPHIPLTNLHAWLANDRATGGIALKIAPATFRDALWLQLVRTLSERVKIRQCRHCNEWFRAGPGTGRRADATSVQTSTATIQ